MRILITGSEGFIARHVRERLPEDAEVMRVDSMEPRVHLDAEPEEAVITREAGWLAAEDLSDFAPDVVIHLGAQVGVADSMQDPWRYVEQNTCDTLSFWEEIRKMTPKPSRFIVASSMSVYGDPRVKEPISESHPVRPESVYGLTKFDQEALSLMYGKMLGISTCALRFWNVYGPGQALHNPYTGVLAIFGNALLKGERPTIFEDGLQTRDFVRVEDVADAVVGMALTSRETGAFNVATGIPTTVYEVATSLARELGVKIAPHVAHERRPGDIRHAIGDSFKLRKALPTWNPRPFSEGVKDYAEFLKSL